MTPGFPSFFENHQLALVGESPTGIRSGLLLEGIDSLLRRCGLVPERYRLVRRDEAATEALTLIGLEQTLRAVGVAGHVHGLDDGPARLSPEAIASALADPDVAELRTGGAGWALTLPLRPGPLMGVSTRPELTAERLPELLSGLLEACQADWAVADAPAPLAAALAGCTLHQGTTEIPPPPLGAFNWRCADWIPEVDWQQATLPIGATCARSFSGASVIQLEPATPAARAELTAALPALGHRWSRPPLLCWQADGGAAQTLRTASPSLLARQQFLAGLVSAHFGVSPAQQELHRALASHWADSASTASRDEAFSAFVGEAATHRGGQWHHILDATIGFPFTLVVIFQGRGSFNPHAALHGWRNGGASPFAALDAFLAGETGCGLGASSFSAADAAPASERRRP